MLNNKKSYALNISILILIEILFGQQLFSQLLTQKAEDFNVKNLKEELYIRTDRDIYVTGEQVWFKVYKINGMSQIPFDLSKVVYLELLDKNNFPLKQVKVKVNDKSGSSGFTLPDNISSGNYVIRAYTNWMQNYPNDQFFYKVISVINPFENIDHIKLPSISRYADTILFYPEGGTLISGISSKIAIKSLDKDGTPVAVTAFLMKGALDTISKVQTTSNGFGTFMVKPVLPANLFIAFKGENGIIKKISLPGISGSGITMAVENKDDKSPFIVKIRKSGNFSASEGGFNFIVYSGGIISSLKEVNIERDSSLTLLQNEFPDGISQFLIFDKEGNQIAGRSVFKENRGTLNYSIDIKKSGFSPREKVKMEITATDKDGKPVASDLSLSVTKSAVTNSAKPINFSNFRLFSPEGNGAISHNAEVINEYLITNESKSLNWKNIINPKATSPDFIPELEGHILSGYMKLKTSDKPLKNIDVSLSYVGKTARCQFGKTDDNGEFDFVVKEAGMSEIVIQPLSPDITGYYVELKQPFCSTFLKWTAPPFYLDKNRIDEINNVILSMQIFNIYEPLKRKIKEIPKTTIANFYGQPEKTIKMADYIELTSLREVVKEIIPNVYTQKQNGKLNFKLINKFSQPFENKPLVLVDGVPIYDFEKVLAINSKDIESADVINTRYFFSENIFDGILSFITKKGNLSAIEFDNSIFRQVYDTYQVPEKFNSPDYSVVSKGDSHLPDFRNTLYWDPDLQTGKDGKTEAEFFTSDESVEYTVVVEGISADGKTGISSIPFKVKQ